MPPLRAPDLLTDSPHTPEIEEILNSFYKECGVTNGSVKDKLTALKKAVGDRAFFAFGGEETEMMELRSNELVFLEEVHGF